jgi:hypothetical protein
MYTALRRITLLLATSSGLIAATTLTAQAGIGINHCQPYTNR